MEKEIWNEAFMTRGLNGNPCFEKVTIGEGAYVIVEGKVCAWNFVDYMRNKDAIYEKYGIISNRGVADWLLETHVVDKDIDALRAEAVEYARKQEEWKKQKEEEKRRRQRQKELVKEHQAEYENAWWDCYYAYSYKFWLKTHLQYFDNEADAKLVWQAAEEKYNSRLD